jgi:hypothetical protein
VADETQVERKDLIGEILRAASYEDAVAAVKKAVDSASEAERSAMEDHYEMVEILRSYGHWE